ncbi:endoribonuclease MazF [Flavobacterium sp.]|jgi:mRNA interferase MazF|uniref:endoribonuclease MazF n=1 Tax=Flavobacterium sp. TaxID=239 RepID=UPI0037C026EE
MPKAYIPDTGDVVWLEFDPQAGHEQAGHRPALVLSPKIYNDRSSLILCCPMTTQIKGYPFEVATLIDGVRTAILADQIKSLDWRGRKGKFKSKISAQDLNEVKAKLKPLLQID